VPAGLEAVADAAAAPAWAFGAADKEISAMPVAFNGDRDGTAPRYGGTSSRGRLLFDGSQNRP
jgi:hypothetical protein